MHTLRRPSPSSRRAMLTVSVLVALTVVMALAAAWTKAIVVERRVVRAQAERVQAEYLALAGLGRGAAQVRATPGYTGETWRIGGDSWGGKRGASVVIRVEPVANEATARIVKVEARFPDESSIGARRSGETKIVLKQAKDVP